MSRIFSSPRLPDRSWGPPNLLPNGHRGLFPLGESGRGVKLTTHFQLVPRSRKYGSPLPHAPSWRSAKSTGQLYLYLYLNISVSVFAQYAYLCFYLFHLCCRDSVFFVMEFMFPSNELIWLSWVPFEDENSLSWLQYRIPLCPLFFIKLVNRIHEYKYISQSKR
jgi:hypothetical protein